MSFYSRYISKDKTLIHLMQHFLVALVSFFVIVFLFNLQFSFSNLILFLVFSFLPDIDGILYTFRAYKHSEEANLVRKALLNFKWKEAMSIATVRHKKFNKLLIHNVVGLFLVVAFFVFSIINSLGIYILIFGAILSHFIFDILDDMYQLGHVKNWLWFFYS